MAIIETIALRDTDYNTLYTTGSATIHTSGGETVPLTYNPASTMYYTDKIKSEQVDDANSTKIFYRAPTLLWENSNPTAEFDAQTISCNPTGYTYLVIEYGLYYLANQGSLFSKFRINPNDGIALCGTAGGSNEDLRLYRNFVLNSAGTQITIGNCYSNQSVDNKRLIPRAIYGTNFL